MYRSFHCSEIAVIITYPNNIMSTNTPVSCQTIAMFVQDGRCENREISKMVMLGVTSLLTHVMLLSKARLCLCFSPVILDGSFTTNFLKTIPSTVLEFALY